MPNQQFPSVILASQSQRRKQLLTWAEVPFVVMISHTEEIIPEGMSPGKAAIYLAKEKAEVVRERILSEAKWRDSIGKPVIAADTIVVLNGEIIGKPTSRDEAIVSLTKLSGQKHEVITGVCLLYENKNICFEETTQVEFHALNRDQITYYVDNYQPFDKAGAYAIQEWIGVVGIRSIQGDFYNVMGLPISRVCQELLLL